MRWPCVILVVFACLAAAPLDPHPLNESQVTRLETVEDDRDTVDEAGFYALLENAAGWSGKEAGAVVPDYDALRRDPKGWRGTRGLIEGTFERVITPSLSRVGWENVRGALIQVNHTRGDNPEPQDYVIVYLTDPPEEEWRDKRQAIPWRVNSTVRLPARFYALSKFSTQAGADVLKSYAVFVGHDMSFPQATGEVPRSGRSTVLFFSLIAVTVFFVIWRVRVMKMGPTGQPRVQEYLDMRHRLRDEPPPRATELDPDLPDNPIDALDALSDKHDRPND